MQAFLFVAAGTGFIFLMNCLGSGMVFFIKKPSNDMFQRVLPGFAAGVMISASIWGLLMPAIEDAQSKGQIGWIPAACGFAIGVLLLLALDKIIPHLHPASNTLEGIPSSIKKTTLLVTAVTLHNIPEGIAVGLSFALAVQYNDTALFASAIALAIGIGIQNFPEGAAVSLPLWQEGLSKKKAFLLGSLSGSPELVFGILTALIAKTIAPLMPWLLSVAAGAMMYVVVEELIPEANLNEHTSIGTISVMAGFVLMMILDVALG